MLQDVNTGVAWVLNNAELYGGDPDSVTLVGQSAGGQLGALALLAQAAQAAHGASGGAALGGSPRWDPARLSGFVGVSSPYNLHALADHLHQRGLYRNLFDALMSVDGRPMLRELSPTHAARALPAGAAAGLPRVLLLQGTRDQSVPMDIAIEFLASLKVGVPTAVLHGTAGLVDDSAWGLI